ncbi:hypothetical protein [Streptomyces hainanensis]|uniref:Uncharacterized protein n=1 Tax=Streptomyces hainanensis TaxID=402648 RepID=A0A4R4TKF6_9ACTN|nr:hypothetical protein [Streptomyces hainanensis]TDC78371.1 hypothetical protein E1283_05225 [Streptomyces hainanensis]
MPTKIVFPGAEKKIKLVLPTRKETSPESRTVEGWEIRPGIVYTALRNLHTRMSYALTGEPLGPSYVTATTAEAYHKRLMGLIGRLEAKQGHGLALLDFFGQAVPLPGHGADPAERDQTATYATTGTPADVRVVIGAAVSGNKALMAWHERSGNGVGSVGYVEFEPSLIAQVDEVAIPPELLLGHELVHAARFLAGTAQPRGSAPVKRTVPVLRDSTGVVFHDSDYEEILTHGNLLALAWAERLEGEGAKAFIRPTEAHLRSDELARAHVESLPPGDPALAAALATYRARRRLVAVSEVTLARELGFVTRPAYTPLRESNAVYGTLQVERDKVPDSAFQRQHGQGLPPELASKVTWGSAPGASDVVANVGDDDRKRAEELDAGVRAAGDTLVMAFPEEPEPRPGGRKPAALALTRGA